MKSIHELGGRHRQSAGWIRCSTTRKGHIPPRYSLLVTRYFPRGFTLIELIVVVLIIAILVAISIPALGAARKYARTVACQAQITALDGAINKYKLDQNAWPCLVGWASVWNSMDGYDPNLLSMSITEQMVIALLGGMVPATNPTEWTNQSGRNIFPVNCRSTPTAWQNAHPAYDPYAVGKGPLTGLGRTIPPLHQLDAYYTYKEEELQDFDGNGLYEIKDKGFGMPVVYYNYSYYESASADRYDSRQNGPKYFMGTSYVINDPRKAVWSDRTVSDPERQNLTHYLFNAAYGTNTYKLYLTTGPGLRYNAGWNQGTWPNTNRFILISAGADGIFGPDQKKYSQQFNGLPVDQMQQIIAECDDVTDWQRK